MSGPPKKATFIYGFDLGKMRLKGNDPFIIDNGGIEK